MPESGETGIGGLPAALGSLEAIQPRPTGHS